MAKAKLNKDYIEKLHKKGKISDDTYRICMAEGGVVPELPDWYQSIRGAVQSGKDLAGDLVDSARAGAKAFGDQIGMPRETQEPTPQENAEVVPAIAKTGESEIVPVSDLAIDQAPMQTQEPFPAQASPFQSSIDAYDKMADSYQASSDAARNAGMAEANAISKTQNTLAAQQAENQKSELDRQQKMEKAEADYKQEVDAYNRLTVDPKRFAKEFWGNASTGQKIVAGIGLIFGGLGNQGNRSVKVFENAINKDIDAQKANLDRAGVALGQKKGVLASMRDRFGDERTAEIAARRAMFESAELDLKRIGSLYKGADAQANMMRALAEIEAKKAELTQQMHKSQLETRAIEAFSGNDPNAKMMAMLPKDVRELYVPGYGLALTKESAAKANEKVAAVNGIKSGITELRSMIGKSKLSPENRAKAETISTYLMGALREEVVGPGAMSEPDREILQSIIANPTHIAQLDSTAKVRLDSLLKRVDAGLSNVLKQSGLRMNQSLDLQNRVR